MPTLPLIMAGAAKEEKRCQPTRLTRFPRPVMNDSIMPRMQQFDEGFGDIDPTASGRAAAASSAVHAQYEGLIDAIGEDRGLSPEQRAVAVTGLRQRQKDEAKAASDAVMAAAMSAASGRSEIMRLAQHRSRPAQQSAGEFGDAAPPQENSGSRPGERPSSGMSGHLFRAAASAVTRRSPNPQPVPRRQRSGDTDKSSVAPWRTMSNRMAKTGAATARGRYAALQPAREPEPAAAYAAATVYAATTFEWLMNLWDANSGIDNTGGLDDSFDTQQNHSYPQP